MTFGTKAEADDSAHRINKLHEVINGKDEITGGIYDALRSRATLWVHTHVYKFLQFIFMKTVRKLSDEENKYHEENSLAAEMVLVDKSLMPKTHKALKEWVIDNQEKDDYFSKKLTLQWTFMILLVADRCLNT